MTPKFQGMPRMAAGQVGIYGSWGGRKAPVSWDRGGPWSGGGGQGSCWTSGCSKHSRLQSPPSRPTCTRGLSPSSSLTLVSSCLM